MKTKVYQKKLLFIISIIIFITTNATLFGQCNDYGVLTGSFSGSHGVNFLLGQKFKADNSGTLTQLGITSTSAGTEVIMALYKDNAGVPGDLVAQTDTHTLTTGSNIINVPHTAIIAGDYWIMKVHKTDGSSTAITLPENDTGLKTTYYTSLLFGSSLPNTYPPSATLYSDNLFLTWMVVCDNTPFTWTGTTNNDWDTATNWDVNTVPHETANVTIPSSLTNYPTASSNITVNKIDMKTESSFIPNGTVSTLEGVSYSRKIADTNWHLICPPVSGDTFSNFITNNTLANGTGSNIGLAEHDNNNANVWTYATASTTNNFNNGEGYSVKKANSSGDIIFSGTLNTTDVSSTIENGTTSNFNLVGNPFTAYFDSDSYTTENTTFLTEETIWIWDGIKYLTYNTINPIKIAPMQGFFVESKDASTSVTIFKESYLKHYSTDTFLKQKTPSNIELSVENSSSKSITKIFFIEGKTKGFDNGYDSKLFSGTTHNLALFTQLVAENEGKKLAIQTLPIVPTEAIPLGIISITTQEITFSVTTTNIAEDKKIYLEDKMNGEIINLEQENYTTTLENSDNIGRFFLHTNANNVLSNNDANNLLNYISIYNSGTNIVSITGLDVDAEIEIYSMLGKQVLKTTLFSKPLNKIKTTSFSKGIYIVKLSTKKGTITKKIALN